MTERDTRSRATSAPGTLVRRVGRLRDRRPALVVLALVGVFALAVIVLAVLAGAQRDATDTLVTPPEEPEGAFQADLAITAVDPQIGELNVRLRLVPLDAGWVEGGLVTRGFRLLVNDIGGQSTYTFPPGDPLRAIDFRVALGGGSVFRYPFDNYEADIVVLAIEGTEASSGEPIDLQTAAVSTLASFDATATSDEDCLGATCLGVEMHRPLPTIGYVMWFVVLVWGLALAGLLMLDTVVRHGIEVPWWSFGYLVGVLFALPPLRASLPDSPPPGGFVDFVAFYWAVTVVGVSLLVCVWLWIRDVRRLSGP